VALADQQQLSERGTTGAGALLAVAVVRLMVVLIRIGYEA
jgi:hypothetical protein